MCNGTPSAFEKIFARSGIRTRDCYISEPALSLLSKRAPKKLITRPDEKKKRNLAYLYSASQNVKVPLHDTKSNRFLIRTHFTLLNLNSVWTSYCSSARPAQPGPIRWLGPVWSDSVIKLVSVLIGKCTTLVVTKCWPMETRLPCGDQWKAEKLGAFGADQ